MKKIYAVILAGCLAGGVSAQQIQKRYTFGNDVNNQVRALKSSHTKGSAVGKSSSATQSGYIDYSWNNINDLSYVWQFNSNYTGADTALSYACVALNQFGVFADYADNTLDWDYMGQNVWPSSMVIDSVFALVTQENNTGAYCKIGFDIIKLNATGAPTTTSTVLATHRDSSNTTMSPGGNWLGSGASFVYSWAPNYTVNLGTDKVGLNLIYKSADGDTASVVGSCINDGNGGTITQSPYATSYCKYPPYLPNIIANRSIIYNGTTPQAYFEAQDFEIWAKVTFDDATIGFNELNKKDFKVYQNAPNPFSGKTTIRYSVNKNTNEIKFNVYDLTGRLVMTKSDKDVAAGDYSIVVDGNQFAKGVYVYSFDVDGVKVTKRMVIE